MFFIPENILTGKEYIYNNYYHQWLIGNPHFVAKDKENNFKELGINDSIEILKKSPQIQSYKYLNLKDIKSIYSQNALYFIREPNNFFHPTLNGSQNCYIDLVLLEKEGKEFISPVFVIKNNKLLPKLSINFDTNNNKLLNILKKIKNQNDDIKNIIYYIEQGSRHSFKKLKSNPNQLVLLVHFYYILLNTELSKAVINLKDSEVEDYFPKDSFLHPILHSQELISDSIKNNIVAIDIYNNSKKYIISNNRYKLDFDLPQFTKPITDYDNVFLKYQNSNDFQFSNFQFGEISSWHTREGLREIYNNMNSIFIKNNNRSLKTEKYFLDENWKEVLFRCEKDGNGYKLKCLINPLEVYNTKIIDAEFYYTPKNKDIKYNDNPNFKLDIKYQYQYMIQFANIQNNPNNKLLIDNWQELKNEPETIKVETNKEYLNYKNFKDVEIYQYLNTQGTIGIVNGSRNPLCTAYNKISKANTINKLIDSRFDFFNDVLNNTHIYIVDTNICRAIGFEKDYWRFMPLQALWFEVNDLYLYTQDGKIDKFNPKYINTNDNFIYDLYLFNKFKFKWYMKCKEVLWDTKLNTKQDFKILNNSKDIKISYCESKRDMYQTLYELFKIAVIRLDNLRLDLEIK